MGRRCWKSRSGSLRVVLNHIHLDPTTFLGTCVGPKTRLCTRRNSYASGHSRRYSHATSDPDLQRNFGCDIARFGSSQSNGMDISFLSRRTRSYLYPSRLATVATRDYSQRLASLPVLDHISHSHFCSDGRGCAGPTNVE